MSEATTSWMAEYGAVRKPAVGSRPPPVVWKPSRTFETCCFFAYTLGFGPTSMVMCVCVLMVDPQMVDVYRP